MHTSGSAVLDPVDTGRRSHPEPPVGALVNHRYRLRAPLGVGSTSTVWLAQDERLRRPVAVKELPREWQPYPGAAGLEAGTAARLASPHVVKVYDFIVDDAAATDWIVMEALSGRDLASAVRSDSRIVVEEARYIGQHLLAALRCVHGAGLVHRDVKPSNVHLCGDGRVVLTDFGLTTTPCVIGGVAAGHVTGSLPYLAPEAIDEGRYSSASDLYALGMTLHVAVTGRSHATTGDDLLTPRDQRWQPDLDALPGRARVLRPLLQGLLDTDPTTRFDALTTAQHLR